MGMYAQMANAQVTKLITYEEKYIRAVKAHNPPYRPTKKIFLPKIITIWKTCSHPLLALIGRTDQPIMDSQSPEWPQLILQ